jgi:hypothetical protein
MKPIQYVLLVLLTLLCWTYFRFFRSRSRDRLVVLAVFAASATFVLVPSWTSVLANQVGVGRGVDLIIYLAIVLMGFICLMLYSQLRQLRAQVTVLARDNAIRAARRPQLGTTTRSGTINMTDSAHDD